MIGINCGILSNAKPLSVERIKEIEKQVIEENQTFAYLDTDGKLCFSMPHGIEGIKALAWHKAYELSKENDIITRKIYVKTGLKTFELTDTVIEDPNAGSDPLMVFDNTLEYTEDMGGYMIVSDKPIDLGGYEDGAPVQIVYSVGDGAKQTLDTYIFGVADGYPMLSNTGTEGGMLHLIHGTEENGLMFACYLNMNANTMSEGSSAIIMVSGDYAPPAEIPTITIWSITKAEGSGEEVITNLLSEPITYTDDDIQLNRSLGLVDGKSYRLEGVYGSDATPFSVTATAMDIYKLALDEAGDSMSDEVRTIYEEGVGVIRLEVTVPTPTDSAPNGEVYVYVSDNGQDRGIDVLKYVENTCLVEFGSGLIDIEVLNTFVLNSITEVESADSGSI